MSEYLNKSVDRWLRQEAEVAHESSGEVAKAEEALASLFQALPSPFEPSPDFARRVLEGVDLPWAATVVARDLGWRGRLLTAFALGLVSFTAFWLLPWIFSVASGFQVAGAVAALADVLAVAVRTLGGLLAWGERLAALGRALWLLASSPQVAIVWLLLASMVYVTWRWLTALVVADRSTLHGLS